MILRIAVLGGHTALREVLESAVSASIMVVEHEAENRTVPSDAVISAFEKLEYDPAELRLGQADRPDPTAGWEPKRANCGAPRVRRHDAVAYIHRRAVLRLLAGLRVPAGFSVCIDTG